MDARDVLAMFQNKTFVGLSDYYPPEIKTSFLRIRLEPQKLVVENKSLFQSALIVHEAEYDDEFRVVAFREKIDGALHKEYSRKEIEEDKYNIISGRFLLRDPRYILQNSKDFIQIAENSFIITVFEDEVALFGKTSIKIEIIFEAGGVRVIRKKFVREDKELNNQREIIHFFEL
ncbi:MAG: hypothetical protein HYV51_03005 [Parcubacteria group bacterium]|nr:hypothetical protein [Parcubacteria group bacterium]